MNKSDSASIKKIVIVDDDDSIRKTFFLLLSKKYKVYLAKNAEEVLIRFRDVSVDLIIADYKLPGMNGIELFRKLRESGYHGEAILISAFPDLIPLDEFRRLSINQFFVKPLDLNVFNKSLEFLPGFKMDLEKRI